MNNFLTMYIPKKLNQIHKYNKYNKFNITYATASQICRIKAIMDFSVRINSSSITRSNSSPPKILEFKKEK